MANVKSLTGKQWVMSTPPDHNVAFVQQRYGLTDRMAQWVINRCPVDNVDIFLDASIRRTLLDPLLLPDMDKVLHWISQLIIDKQPIGVWGDYDVDGACASALLVRYLRRLGAVVHVHIPNRFSEGYGPNTAGLLALKEKGANNVITVDCGTSAFEPLQAAKQAGMKIVVIDHHEHGAAMADAWAIINPKRSDFAGPKDLSTLSAAGVTFLFLVGLNRHLRQCHFFETHHIAEPVLMDELDMVALSTVCDMMPLGPMNRAFVKAGQRAFQKQGNKGLLALIRCAKVRGVISSYHLGFRLGPRINAPGRLGDSSLGVRLLCADNDQDALAIAAQMEQLNVQRQSIEKDVMDQVRHHLGQWDSHKKGYVLAYGDDWHEGVVGIVAGRLKEEYGVPCFVLSNVGGVYKGSARSAPGIDLAAFVDEAKQASVVCAGGGHAMAAGLSVDASSIGAFIDFADDFFQRCRARLSAPSLTIDGVVTLEQIQSDDFVNDLDALSPFGAGCPVPLFIVSRVKIQAVSVFCDQHLRVRLTQANGFSVYASWFRVASQPLGQQVQEKGHDDVDCVVSVRIETFLGVRKPSIMIEDIAYQGWSAA